MIAAEVDKNIFRAHVPVRPGCCCEAVCVEDWIDVLMTGIRGGARSARAPRLAKQFDLHKTFLSTLRPGPALPSPLSRAVTIVKMPEIHLNNTAGRVIQNPCSVEPRAGDEARAHGTVESLMFPGIDSPYRRANSKVQVDRLTVIDPTASNSIAPDPPVAWLKVLHSAATLWYEKEKCQ